MAKLTKKEQSWVNKVQKVLNECPSKRIGFYTIGDSDLTLFDITKIDEIYNLMDAHVGDGGPDFGPLVVKVGADFNEELYFPNSVETAQG